MADATTTQADAPKRTYRGVAHEDRQADRRRRLMETATELYATKGYANVPIQLVCKESGVTARHFYEAFPNREALLQAIHDEIVQDSVAQILAAVAEAPGDDAMAWTRAGLRAFYDGMLGDPRRARITTIEVLGLPSDQALACVDQFVSVIEFYAQQLSDAGLIEVPSVHLASVILAGAVRQLLVDWLQTPDHVGIEALVDITSDLFARVGTFTS